MHPSSLPRQYALVCVAGKLPELCRIRDLKQLPVAEEHLAAYTAAVVSGPWYCRPDETDKEFA